tara:strand:+ start:226 stop:474 length:249 start_codon:yes stop_codon:yes gene_type:complete
MSNSSSTFYSPQILVLSDKMPPITRQLAFNNSSDNPFYPRPEINLTDEVNLDNEILFRSGPNINDTLQTTKTQDKKTIKTQD